MKIKTEKVTWMTGFSFAAAPVEVGCGFFLTIPISSILKSRCCLQERSFMVVKALLLPIEATEPKEQFKRV